MKHQSLLVSLLLSTAVLLACSKNGLSHTDEFLKSYMAFLDFKKSTNNSYRYTVVGGSWVGFGWQTTITVTGGKVTKRYFSLTPTPGSQYQREEWTEEGNEIGSHRDGSDAVTLDFVYGKAKTEWLRKRDGATIYFRQGIMA